MINYISFNEAGEEIKRGTCTSAALPVIASECSNIQIVETLPNNPVYFKNNTVIEIPNSPSKFHKWGIESDSWEMDENSISQAKHSRKQLINLNRDNARNAGFMAFGKLFDSNEAARTNIMFAAQAAMLLPDTFTIDWTCADNTQITLNKEQLLQLPVLLVSAGDALHQKALALKVQIDAATTLEEIEAVIW